MCLRGDKSFFLFTRDTSGIQVNLQRSLFIPDLMEESEWLNLNRIAIQS